MATAGAEAVARAAFRRRVPECGLPSPAF